MYYVYWCWIIQLVQWIMHEVCLCRVKTIPVYLWSNRWSGWGDGTVQQERWRSVYSLWWADSSSVFSLLQRECDPCKWMRALFFGRQFQQTQFVIVYPVIAVTFGNAVYRTVSRTQQNLPELYCKLLSLLGRCWPVPCLIYVYWSLLDATQFVMSVSLKWLLLVCVV